MEGGRWFLNRLESRCTSVSDDDWRWWCSSDIHHFHGIYPKSPGKDLIILI